MFGKKEYKRIVEKIINCLEETYEDDGLLYSAHDADTNHEEGTTYLWSYEELKDVLKEDFSKLNDVYVISREGNFEGKNHLIKSKNIFLNDVEKKLLSIRKKREQPFIDKKFVTSWNSLAGIGLLMAYRFTGNEIGLKKAKNIFEKLLKKHYINDKLHHSSLSREIQKNEFLEDYASLLLFATYLYEEMGEYEDIIKKLYKKMKEFYKDRWYESSNVDFKEVVAQNYDHPIPSSVSLAEYATLRAKVILGEDYMPKEYQQALAQDFYNIVVLASNGDFHEIHVYEKINWNNIPVNAIIIHGNIVQDCFKRTCREFKNVQELVKSLKF